MTPEGPGKALQSGQSVWEALGYHAEALRRPVSEGHLQDLSPGVLLLQGLRGVQDQKLAMVDDPDPPGQAVGLVHLVCGEEDGLLPERE